MRLSFFFLSVFVPFFAHADFNVVTCKQMWTGWRGQPGPSGATFSVKKIDTNSFRVELDMLDDKGLILSSLYQNYSSCLNRGNIPESKGWLSCDEIADEAFSLWLFGDRVELHLKTAKSLELEPRSTSPYNQFAKWFSIESCQWR